MKAKYIFAALVATLLCTNIFAQPRIAVLEFNAGVGILQSDVNGLSAMFNTYFSPEGYIVVERTRVSRVLEEQDIQVAAMTEEQRVRLGQILNVSVIIIGDVNYAMKQYNVDVRAVNVETGGILAKDGIEFKEGSSYREMMKTLAEQISKKIPIVEFHPIEIPTPVVVTPEPTNEYRQTGGYIRFLAGYTMFLSLAYDYQISPYFMIGCGAGYGYGTCQCIVTYDNPAFGDINGTIIEAGSYPRNEPAIPIYFETELRTPKYKWSLFINAKAGIDIFTRGELGSYLESNMYRYTYKNQLFFATLIVGASYKNLNLGAGVSTAGEMNGLPAVISISYNFPLKKMF